MADATISARLVEVETLLEKSRKRFEEGAKLADEAHALIAELQQQLIGAPVNLGGSRDDADDVASKLLASLKAQGSELPPTLCGGRMAVDQVQRLIRIDGHPIAITEMEYRVLELLAFARNNVVTRTMLLKHLYRRADDQPQPKIIDVFISKLRKKLRMASGGAEFIETIPQRGWILRDLENSAQRSVRHRN
jgi:DNA-binding response OmpR family regulator